MKFKKITKRFALALGLIALALGMAACQSKQNSSPAKQNIIDMTGKKVTVSKKVNRLADLWHANNQIVLMLGGQKKIVATTPMIKKQGWFNLVDPQIKKAASPTTGQDIQIEELLKTKPDLVIAADPGQVKQARNAKLPTLNLMFQNFAGLKKSVSLTGKILGSKESKMAKRYNSLLDQNLQEVKQKTRKSENKPRVLHIVDSQDLYKVDGRKTIVDEWIKAAGAQNAVKATGNMITLNSEEIIKNNPQVIIIGQTSTAKARKLVRNNSVLKQTAAAKNNRVYGNPQGCFPWDRYSGEEALQVLWAAKLFHPNDFRKLNLVKRTQAFYQEFYHFRLSSAQAKRILTGEMPRQ